MMRGLAFGVVVALALALGGAARSTPSALAPAVLAEINYVRANPRAYAEQLRDGAVTPTTEEAIAELRGHRPVPPLSFEPGLGDSATRHAYDEGRHASFEHDGSDGSTAGERMRRAGVWAGVLAEEMSAGEESARDVVRQMIVDEGVPSRGHRRDLLDPVLRRAGVGCAPHPVYGVICVVDLASSPPRGD
jgi:uncharacterized protein YkwD